MQYSVPPGREGEGEKERERGGERERKTFFLRLIMPCYFLTIARQCLNIVQRGMNLTSLFESRRAIYECFINNILLRARITIADSTLDGKV